MPVIAKWNNVCPKCQIRFVVGRDELVKDAKLGKWVHANCSVNRQYTNRQKELVGSSYSSVNVPLPIEDNPVINFDNLALAISEDERIPYDCACPNEQEHEEGEWCQTCGGYYTDGTKQGQAKRNNNKPVDTFVPSKYQQAIFDFIQFGEGHAVVEAVAGSGKTTTIVHALDLTPKDSNVAFIAFNKHIVAELQKRSPEHVLVSTMHKLGLDTIKANYPGVKVDSKGEKLDSILNEIWPVSKQAIERGIITKEQKKKNYPKRSSMRKLVGLCKSTLSNVNDKQEIITLIDRYNVEMDSNHVDEIVEQLPIVMEKCKSNLDVIDFDDMPWLPVVLNMKCEKFDFLMVDEFQDMSYGNIEFLLMCLSDKGRMICVGDRYQSLYAFRGAASDAIPMAIKRLQATVLPLSVTYRCPVSHVHLAQEIVPHLEARDNAPDGQVKHIDYFDLIPNLKPRDMVICRTNAPLIKPAFECVRRGMKAIIRSDIEKQLLDLINRFDTDNLNQFEIELMNYYSVEFQRKMDMGKEMQAEQLKDKYDTLNFIIAEGGNIHTVWDLKKKIKSIFGEDVDRIVFSSVHKAKGLEAERIFILRPDLMPHPRAKKDFEVAQEMNARYVSITRSKSELYFVEGGKNV